MVCRHDAQRAIDWMLRVPVSSSVWSCAVSVEAAAVPSRPERVVCAGCLPSYALTTSHFAFIHQFVISVDGCAGAASFGPAGVASVREHSIVVGLW